MTPDRPGFAEPVSAAQATFRAVLDAFSSPGRVMTAGEGLRPPSPLCPAAASVLLAMVDGDSPLWLDGAAHHAADWLRFHCGAVLVTPDAACFGFALTLPGFEAFAAGSDETPEDGATLVVQLPALGTGRCFRLDGPGLREPATLLATGLPDDFAARWADNHARFPRGIDLILCSGERLAALPRSVAVTEA